MSEWLTNVADVRLSERTARDYRQYASRYIVPTLGEYRLSQLSAAHVQATYAEMLAQGPRACDSSVGARYGVKTNVQARNPADATMLPKQVRGEMRALSPIEARRVIAAAKDDHWEDFWLDLLALGLRPRRGGSA